MSSLTITTRVLVCPDCAAAISLAAPVSRYAVDRGHSTERAAGLAVGSPSNSFDARTLDADEIAHRKADHFEVLLGLLKILAAPTDRHASDLAFWRARAARAIASAEAILGDSREAP